MAQPKKRMQATGQPHSVLDAPEYIAGVPGKKNRATKGASRDDKECESVLDGHECMGAKSSRLDKMKA